MHDTHETEISTHIYTAANTAKSTPGSETTPTEQEQPERGELAREEIGDEVTHWYVPCDEFTEPVRWAATTEAVA